MEIMDTQPQDRKIDDPELNRDVDYHKKDDEDFDDTDDFHKNDPVADGSTTKDTDNKKTKPGNSGKFTGEITI